MSRTKLKGKHNEGWNKLFETIEKDREMLAEMRNRGRACPTTSGDSFQRKTPVFSKLFGYMPNPAPNKHADYKAAKALYGPKKGCPM